MSSLKNLKMFQKARKELHKHLKKYMFSLVSRGVTIPPDCVEEGGEVSHYYTTSEELAIGSRKKGGSVWIKKKARVRQHQLGPVLLASSTSLPKPGDVVFGEVIRGAEQKFGKQSFKTERQSYKWWLCPGAPLYYLATMVLKGTSETEESLRKLLKLQGDYDDLWMLARVVLFNNVQCFADMLNPELQSERRVKLREQPAVFIQQLSLWLDDFSVLTEFQKLVPETTSLPPPLSAVDPFPTKQFIGRKRRQLEAKSEEYDPDDSNYFSHRQPAGYTSGPGPSFSKSPKYAPPYAPASPPYAPVSPPYAPASPPYAPESPTYAPFTPPHM